MTSERPRRVPPALTAVVVGVCVAVTVVELRLRLFARDLEQIVAATAEASDEADARYAEALAAGAAAPELSHYAADPERAPSEPAIRAWLDARERVTLWSEVCVEERERCERWGGAAAEPLRRWRESCDFQCGDAVSGP